MVYSAPAVAYGCCAGAAVVAAAPAAPAAPSLTPQEIDAVRNLLRNMANKDGKTAQESSVPGNVARISVKVPSDARLWVDHVECPLTSSVRSFNTPPLEQGREYAYTLRVQVQRDGQTVSERQRVVVAAGKRVNVDFTGAGSLATAQR